ncbi:MAG: endonuclease/exonuclease/phosphatase family protein [Acidimicrobiia bacterium]|nr:endonuclease/exonuclease/phosphatase family protein [Acidimicrobiia bacterium]
MSSGSSGRSKRSGLRWRRVGGLVAGTVRLLGWPIVVALTLLSASRLGVWLMPPMVQAAQAVTPVVYLPVWAVAIGAVFTRRRWLGLAAAALAVVHVAVVAPALGRAAQPDWTLSAPTFRLLVANVYKDNPRPVEVADLVRDVDADVVVLVEATPQLADALDLRGVLDDYPYRAGGTRADPRGSLVLSRLPITAPIELDVAGTPPVGVTITVADRPVDLVAVHPLPPLTSGAGGEWFDQHGAFAGLARRDRYERVALALAGDFNATRWQPPFGQLLDAGLDDIHESVGRGLSRSWPARGGAARSVLGPLARLDHALVSPGLFPLEVTDLDVPGSDHRGFVTRLAVR